MPAALNGAKQIMHFQMVMRGVSFEEAGRSYLDVNSSSICKAEVQFRHLVDPKLQ